MLSLSTVARTALLSVALACAGLAQAQMKDSEVGDARDRIEADYKAAKAACDRLSGNAKDICQAEAKGKDKVAKADLQLRRSGRAEDERKVLLAKADAAYDVAKERCDDLKGNERDVCVKEAKATETRMKNDAKTVGASEKMQRNSAEDQREADYKVAIERCDSLTGAAKNDCLSAARARFGKS